MPWYEYSSRFSPPGTSALPIIEIVLRHDARSVVASALVDSGADSSLFDADLAAALGLNRRSAQQHTNIGADGAEFTTLRWPDAPIELLFESEQIPFEGSFIAFPPGATRINLLGRGDFFQRFVVQFWEAAELLNIDLSPDFPRLAV